MSSIIGFGPGGTQRFSRNSNRSVMGDGVGSIRYPSPFFDIAHTYMPSSYKTMLRWCRYYFLSNPLINAVCYKMAEYPVTDLIFDSESDHENQRWRRFFERVLKFKKFEVEAGLDYNAFGNCFISIFIPFIKYLRCKRCRHSERVDRVKYTFKNFGFHGSCRSCGAHGELEAWDHHIRSIEGIRLIRWNPETISIQHNEATGETQYFYTIPGVLANDIKMAKRHVIEKTPQIFIEALRRNKSLLFDESNIFHLKRATIAQKDKGWGLPMILPVLKDTFYLQILRKAQEAIAIEHVVPLRVLFPQSASGTSDVYSTINLQNWKQKVEQEILRWRLDNNYIPILPLPIGQQTLGAEGRALMLAQEYRVWAEHIVAGMGVPTEFVFGGLSYSGSNVSLRILENKFLDHKADHHALVDWIMERVGSFMGWRPIPHHFRRFKMADDLQRSAFNLQLNQAGKLSDESLLEETDWDAAREAERIANEQKRAFENQRRQALSQADIQGEAQLTMQKYQMRAQKMMMELQQMQMQPQPGDPVMDGMQPAMAGEPGMMSPNAQGQMMNQQTGMMNMSGQSAAMAPPLVQDPSMLGGPQGEMPGAAQSPLNAGQNMGADPSDPSALATRPSLEDIAARIAAHLDSLPDAEKQRFIVELQQNNPQLYSIVVQFLGERKGAHKSSAGMPQPQQRAPRRGPESVTA